MKKRILFMAGWLFTLFSINLAVSAQDTLNLGAGTSSSSTRGPFQRSDTNSASVYSRNIMLFTAAELSAAGIVSGSTITELQWEKGNSTVIVGSGNANLKVYLKDTTSTATTSDTWSTYTNNSTLVFNTDYNTTNNFPASSGWMSFVLATPYVYNGGAIEIAVDWDASGITAQPGDNANQLFSGNGAVTWRWAATAGNTIAQRVGTSSAPTNLSNLKSERANTRIIYNAPVAGISTFPYLEDFETNNGGYTVTGTNASWAYGIPSASVIASSNGCGSNAWVTNLTGSYNSNEDSQLESPVFDFGSLTTDPILRFDHQFETEGCCDEGWVELSLDGGTTWNKLGSTTSGLANWYNDATNDWWDGSSNGWRTAAHVLTGAAGQSNVQFRFVVDTDGSVQRDGFAVDNIIVGTVLNDPSAFAVIQPSMTSGMFTSTEQIEMSVANEGTTPITSIQLCYNLNNGTPVCETFATNINPTAIDTFLFTQTADLSMAGTYDVELYIGTANDYICNDTLNLSITSIACLAPTANSGTNSLTASSAEVSWVENGTATSWRVEWDTTGYAAGTARNTMMVTDTFANLTMLMAETTYDWNVSAICSATDSSAFVGGTFTSLCAAFTAPFVEDFATFVPNCWEEADNGDLISGPTGLGSGSWSGSNYTNSASAGSGVKVNLYTNSRSEWILSPVIDLSGVSSYELAIDAAVTNWNSSAADNMGSDDSVQVVISTDGGTTWTSLYSWNVSNQPPASGALYRIDLAAYNTANNIIGIYATDGPVDDSEDYDFHIGSFEIRVPPACLAPTANASTDSLAADFARVNWTDNAGATSWRVEWDTIGYAAGSARNTMMVTDTFANLTMLMSQSSYDWNVRALCNATDSSSLVGGSFTTPCGSFVPSYSEDFSTYVPNCWSEAKGQLTANTTFTSTTSSNWATDGFLNSGTSGAARMNIWSTNRFEWLISPSIDLGATPNTFRLEFDAGLTDFSGSGTDMMGPDDTLSVVISTDNGATWSINDTVKVFTVNNPPSNTGETVLIDLSSYTGVVKVGFYATSTISNTDYNVYIDNFQVRIPPACPTPTSNSAVAQATSADVSWVENGTATQWQVEWDTTGTTLGNSNFIVVNTDTFTTLSPLFPQSDYDWRVRAICGTGDTSAWTSTSTFTTPCAPLVAPLLENFDGLPLTSPYRQLPNCWEPQTGPDYWDVTNDVTNNGHAYLPNIGDHTTGSANYMWIDASGNITGNAMETPMIDMSALTVREVGFWFASDNTTNDVNHTVNMDAWDGSAWVTLNSIRGNFNGWTELSVIVPASIPTVSKFRIQAIADIGTTASTYFYNDLGVDDFFVREGPSCPKPIQLASFNVTGNTADVTWDANSSGASSWLVEWDTAGFAAGTARNSMVFSNDTASLTGLMQLTSYDWTVRTICAVGDSSVVVTGGNFVTPATCPAPSALSDVVFSHDSVELRWTDNSTATSWQIEYDTVGFTLGTGNSIVTSTNPDTLINLMADTDYQWYVRAICSSTDSSFWVGPNSFSTPPTCPAPSALSANTLSQDSVELSWTNNSSATTWEVEYGTPGFTPGTGTTFVASSTTDTVVGLTAATNYEWYVRAICSSTDTSFRTGPSSFRTACPASIAAPFADDFESHTPALSPAESNCWTASSTDPNNDWNLDGSGGTPSSSTGPNGANSGNNYFYTEGSGGVTGDTALLNSPNIDLSTLTTPRMSFFYHMYDAGSGEMGNLYIDVFNGTSYVLVDSLIGAQQANQADPYLKKTIDLSSFTGVVSIRFRFAFFQTHQGDMAIDDFVIEETPNCLAPTALTSSNATLTSIDLDWTENNSATSWEVEYGPVGFTPGNGTIDTANAKPFTLNGLMASTSYEYYVRSICNATSTSNNSTTGSFRTLNGVPYFEDFETFNTGVPNSNGWTNTAGTSAPNWVADAGGTTSSSTGPTVDHTLGNATGQYVYLETSGGSLGDVDTLTSAPIIISATQNLLELSYWYHFHGASMGDLEVYVIDGTGAYNLVGNISGQQQANQTDPYLKAKHIVSGYASQTIQLAFVGARGGSYTGDMAIDDVSIDTPPANEIGVTNIIRPISGCGLTATDSIEIEITNFGGMAQSNFMVGYSVNGAAAVTETVSAVVNLGSSINYTFQTPVNLSASGVYSIETFTLLVNDSDSTNDTLSTSISSFGIVSTFPYNESFENGAGSWMTDSANNNTTWNLGAPNGAIIDTASDGTQAWVTNLNGNYVAGENGAVVSPCFDFSNLTNPYITFDLWFDNESGWDGAVMQTSIDGGATWQNVGAFGDTVNWYNDNSVNAITGNNISTSLDGWSGSPGSLGWIKAEHFLDSLGGQPSVQIRIAFASDGSVFDEGTAFDNVTIFDSLPADPYYPIAILNTEDAAGVADSLNVSAFTSGTVVGIDLDGNNGISFTIIDMSSGVQEGMNIFNFNDVSNYVVTEGDSILVHGDIAQFNGLTELIPDSISIISTGNAIPTPIVVSDLTEAEESRWLSIPTDFIALDSTNGTFSQNIRLTNNVDTIVMRIDSDTDILDSLAITPAGKLNVGDTICGMFGIGGQFDNSNPYTDGYQIFPMRWSDLTFCRLATGIETIEIEASVFSLVPNPTNGQFEIRTSGFNNSIVNITVRDMNGRVISEENISNATNAFNKSFDLTGNAKGMYFISIQDGENVIIEKLIVQ